MNTAIAGSQHHNTLGEQALLGLSRQTAVYSMGFQTSRTTVDYRQLGYTDDAPVPKLSLQAFAGYYAPHIGSFNTTYTEQSQWHGDDLALATLGYNVSLTQSIFFMVSGVKSVKGDVGNSIYAAIIWSPKESYTATLSAFRQQDNDQTAIDWNKAVPLGPGYGYHLYSQAGEERNNEADVTLHQTFGSYMGRYSRFEGTNNYELDTQGSVILFNKQVFLNRALYDGFSLVQVSDNLPNIPVYNNNQYIGKTDKNGNIIIPNTLEYQKNDISIMPQELPLDVAIDATRMPSMPYYRSGDRVAFPIYKIYTYQFTLQQDNQLPVDTGTLLQIDELTDPIVVGFNGFVYIESPEKLTSLHGQFNIGDKSYAFRTDIKTATNKQSFFDLGILQSHE